MIEETTWRKLVNMVAYIQIYMNCTLQYFLIMFFWYYYMFYSVLSNHIREFLKLKAYTLVYW